MGLGYLPFSPVNIFLGLCDGSSRQIDAFWRNPIGVTVAQQKEWAVARNSPAPLRWQAISDQHTFRRRLALFACHRT